MVLSTVHRGNEEKGQSAQIEAFVSREKEKLRLSILYRTLKKKRERRNNAFLGNHLKDSHRQSCDFLNLNFMGCILIM